MTVMTVDPMTTIDLERETQNKKQKEPTAVDSLFANQKINLLQPNGSSTIPCLLPVHHHG